MNVLLVITEIAIIMAVAMLVFRDKHEYNEAEDPRNEY